MHGVTPVVARRRGPEKMKLALAPPVPFQDRLPASLFIEYGGRFD